MAKPRAEVSEEKKKGTYRKWLRNTHLNLLSFDFSIEISTFSFFSIETSTFLLFFYWSLYFLFTFLLKSLISLYISISTFSLLFYWDLYFLVIFLLKPLFSLYFSIAISNFALRFYLYFLFTFLLKPLLSFYFSYWNLYFLFTFPPKPLLSSSLLSIGASTFSLLFSLLSLCCSVEISTFSLFFYWDLYPHVRLHHICTSIILRQIITTPCFRPCNYSKENFKKLCPACHAERLTPLASTSNWHTDPRLPRELQPLDWATSWFY